MNTIRAATFLALLCLPLAAAEKQDKSASPQEQALAAYFEQQVGAVEGQLERDIKTKEDWLAKKDEYRRQLAEMLGLDPMPPRTDLKPVVTGTFEHEGIVVENLQFQASPGLYVTANFCRPKVVEKPLPTILYVCGHGGAMKDGISYGNKTHYEHHGVWYAKHGFTCLVIDTVELGEIRGEHHGTFSKGRFWWWSRGYTPAGCEAWQGIRALDYLETRPEVDKTRFGVTGRSGGGAYSWYIAALDERIKAAAPTAGITTLRNHIVDGCVEGHCDCMFMNNTYRWDYDKVAALVAPRALCVVNTDKDTIFPIDGVFRVYQGARRIYKLLGAEKNIGLQIAEGPHQDSQPLNVGEFHWMTRFLQGAEPMSTLDSPAVHSIAMEKLRVFKELPKDETNTTEDERLVPMAAAAKVPESGEEWGKVRDGWLKAVREKCFAAEPAPSLKFCFIDGSYKSVFVDGKKWGFSNAIYRARYRNEGRTLFSNGTYPSTHAQDIEDAATAFTPWDANGSSISNPFPNYESETRDDRGHLEKAKKHLRYIIKTAVDSPSKGITLSPQSSHGVTLSRFNLITYDVPELELLLVHRQGLKPADLELLVLNVLDEPAYEVFSRTYASGFPRSFSAEVALKSDDKAFEQEKKMFENFKWGMAYVCPRGIGPTAWDSSRAREGVGSLDALGAKQAPGAEASHLLTKAATNQAKAAEKTRVQRLRRYYLLGQTLEGQQVWDVRCAIRALRSIEGLKDTKLWLQANRTQAANVLMASLFEDNITRLDLHELPHSLMPSTKDKDGHPISGDEPVYLNMLKYLDLPQAAAMAAERTRVVIYDDDKAAWSYPAQVAEKLGWGKEKKNGLQLRDVPKEAPAK